MQSYPKTAELKDHRKVVLRPLASGDFDKLFAFFGALPDGDRLFLRDDVGDPDLVREWTENIDRERIIPLVAEDGDKIVADGTLHMGRDWSQHAGLIRLVTARTHRDVGLETLIIRELVALAQKRRLEKLQVQVISEDRAQVQWFHRLGFETAGVLRDAVKDQNGENRDLTIMVDDVDHLAQAVKN